MLWVRSVQISDRQQVITGRPKYDDIATHMKTYIILAHYELLIFVYGARMKMFGDPCSS